MFSKGNEPVSAGTLMNTIDRLLTENHELRIRNYELINQLKRASESRNQGERPLVRAA